MGFFRTQEEKEAQRLLEEKIANLDRFPGNLAEYVAFKGQEYAIIDTGEPRKYVRDSKRLLAEFVKQGCEALIHYREDPNQTHINTVPYGVPVKKKPAE